MMDAKLSFNNGRRYCAGCNGKDEQILSEVRLSLENSPPYRKREIFSGDAAVGWEWDGVEGEIDVGLEFTWESGQGARIG